MLFNSLSFMIFFPIVVIGYWIIPTRARNLWLLIASYYFYMSWGTAYGFLIAVITLITYCAARLMTAPPGLRRAFLYTTCVICIGILCFFKYSNFIIANLNILTSTIGLSALQSSDIVLSIGISFYTLQALGYVIDVYRNRVPAENNIVNYALFVSFFLTVVSGPIERSNHLLRQIDHPQDRTADYYSIVNGLITMLYGLFLKMVIADRISILVDNVYSKYMMYQSVELLIGCIAYSIQIYCDFASYSAIAAGAAQVMGFSLIENFNTPYLATSIKDFWRRWHISLSSWLRDYVYIPLGGNQCGTVRKHINVMVTFLVSGLWHGANWTFIVWGGLHGFYQVAGDLLSGVRGRIFRGVRKDCFSYRFGQTVITFFLVSIAWIFFRSDSVDAAWTYITRMFLRINPWALFDGTLYNLGLDRTEMNILLVAVVVMLAVDLMQHKHNLCLSNYLSTQNLYFKWGAVLALFIAVLIYGKYGVAFDAQQFIYFQF